MLITVFLNGNKPWIFILLKSSDIFVLVVVNCDFDTDWCGFRNEKNRDDFDWTKTSKKTPSSGTGPEHDLSGKGV